MLSNIPKKSDYEVCASELIDLVMEDLTGLCQAYFLELGFHDEWSPNDLECNSSEAGTKLYSKVSDEFLARHSRRVLSMITNTQQAAELLLKGRIADVSPFLLIKDTSKLAGAKKNLDFDEFTTIDAKDLVGFCNNIHVVQLPDDICQKFSIFRLMRNKSSHSPAKSSSITPAEIVDYLFSLITFFFSADNFIQLLRSRVEQPMSSMDLDDFVVLPASLVASFCLIGIPSQVERWTGHNPRDMREVCDYCSQYTFDEVKTVTKELWCYICER